MEEILSSIRKIIEDGEPAQSTDSLSAATKPEPVEAQKLEKAEPVVAEPAVIDSSAPEIEEFRRELTGASHPVADDVAGEADVMKAEDAAPAAAPEPEQVPPAEFTVPDVVDEKPVLEATESSSDPEPVLPEEDDEIGQDVFPVETTQRLSGEPIAAVTVSEENETADLEPDPAPVEETTSEQSEPSEQAEPQVPEIQAARPIISEVAGRKIAASFEQLSEAFAETRKKSFDEMAEEMLRPMLQEDGSTTICPCWWSALSVKKSSAWRAAK